MASVYDLHYDFVVWNEPYPRIRTDPGELPDNRRNLLWMLFADQENRAQMLDRPKAARSVRRAFEHTCSERTRRRR